MEQHFSTSIRSNPLLPVAISLSLGIMGGFLLPLSQLPLSNSLLILLCLLTTSILSYKWPLLQSMMLMATIAALGCCLALRKQHTFQHYHYDEHQRLRETIVIAEPVEKDRSIAIDVLIIKSGRKVRCYFEKDKRAKCLVPGDGLLIAGSVAPCTERLNDGFHYRRYMEGQGFSGQCYVRSNHWQRARISLHELSRFSRLRIAFLRLRHKLLARYRLLGADDDRYGVLAAMTLGDKSALSKELREVYAVSGASHILALSGMHLGILYLLLTMITFSHHQQRVWSQALTVVAVWAFAMLTGLSTSVVRSAIMISCFAVFSVGHRNGAPLNTLSLSAIIILCQNPYALFDVGFQLSFGAVLSILLLTPLMTRWKGVPGRLGVVITGCIQVSLAAQIGVAPLLAYHFGRFSTYFLLTNLIVLPAAYLILYGSLLMLLIPWTPLSVGVTSIVSGLNSILTQINRWPLASIEGLHPSVLQVILCYLIIVCLSYAVMIWQGRRPKKPILWYDPT